MPKKTPEVKVGDVFGQLEIIGTERDEKNSLFYKYRCSCGKEKRARKHDLTAGKIISCGCAQLTQRDLIGKKINHITVLELHHKDQSRNLYYTYKCDCGYVDTCCVQQLIDKYSCGCIKRPKEYPEYIGKTFQNLTIMKCLGLNDKGKTYFEYKCKCGNTGEILLTNIDKIISCGCDRKAGSKKHLNYEEITHIMWTRSVLGANKRSLEFSVTKEEAWEVFLNQQRKCAISGVDLIMEGNIKKYSSRSGNASMDRKDSTKGYTKDNIQWVDKKINIAKMNMEDSEFIAMCKRVANYNP